MSKQYTDPQEVGKLIKSTKQVLEGHRAKKTAWLSNLEKQAKKHPNDNELCKLNNDIREICEGQKEDKYPKSIEQVLADHNAKKIAWLNKLKKQADKCPNDNELCKLYDDTQNKEASPSDINNLPDVPTLGNNTIPNEDAIA